MSACAASRRGNAHPNIAPYQVCETADGHIVIAVGNDGQFAVFARLIGRPELAVDPRFETNRRRVENRAALIAEIAPAIRTKTSKAWLEALESAGAPAGPINAIDAVFADPQTRARGMAGAIEGAGARADAPDLQYVPHPVKYSATPARNDLAPPALGAHTREVLASALGLGAAEIDALAEKGVIGV
ncbi:MAG: hypothetical protein Kow00133_19290 [Amphiplicatus sp.]